METKKKENIEKKDSYNLIKAKTFCK